MLQDPDPDDPDDDRLPEPDDTGPPRVPHRSRGILGPRRTPTLPPRMVDRAAGLNPDDWTSFDVSKSMRILRLGTLDQKRRELRKLHLRCWHATRDQLHANLNAAGVPSDVLEIIPAIVGTCRECRA